MTFLKAGGEISTVRSRVVKTKRGHLATMIFKEASRQCRNARLRSMLRARRLTGNDVILAQGHSRFGTSSQPAVGETHPHQWLGEHMDRVWIKDSNGSWSCEWKPVCITITHNGDFDALELYNSILPNDKLGVWLSKAMHHTNPAKGDSPKLAGFMDLWMCKGRWIPAARLAFALVVLTNAEEIVGWEPLSDCAKSAMPSQETMKALGRVLEQAFVQAVQAPELKADVEAGAKPDAVKQDEKVAQLATKYLTEFLWSPAKGVHKQDAVVVSTLLADWGMSKNIILDFCRAASKAFFYHDTTHCVREFFHRAEGTFAISVTTSLEPNNVVLAAKGQPLSVAFDMRRPMAIWASEPRSLAMRWPDAKELASHWAATLRFDLKDASGEAIALRLLPAEDAAQLVASSKDWIQPPEDPGAEPTAMQFCMRSYPLGDMKSEALTRSSFCDRAVRLMGPAPIPFTPKKKESLQDYLESKEQGKARLDPIASDLQDVPQVLEQVETAWRNKNSLNSQAGQQFTGFLSDLVRMRSSNDGATTSSSIDVLVLGIENSLWLGQQFAADLKAVFPRLNVTALSSNWVLGLLQKGHGHVTPMNFTYSSDSFSLTPGAVVLSISQSGTTYPTVWASRLLARLNVRLFAMSGEFDTVLANSIGQELARDEFCGRLFSTMAGIRPCEPSTVATMAMHHTLTWLLLSVAKHSAALGYVQEQDVRDAAKARHAVHAGEGPLNLADVALSRLHEQKHDQAAHADRHDPAKAHHVPECKLRLHDTRHLMDMARRMIESAEFICGVTREGQLVPSHTREGLLSMGAYLAQHLMEGWLALLLGAVYVYVTVTMGKPLVSGSCESLVAFVGLETDLGIALGYVLRHLDAWLYVFLAALLATLHRLLTGRRPWTWYTGRTLVIAESTVNYKLLRAFASKLRSLAFRFNAFGVCGQNPQDHLVHELTHLTTSDTVVLLGRPDGRLGTLAAAEAATIMSVQQARFIAGSACSGIEAYSIGHNPWTKPGLFAKSVVLPCEGRPAFASAQLLSTSAGGHAPGHVVSCVAAHIKDTAENNSNEGNLWKQTQHHFCNNVTLEEVQTKMKGQKMVSHEQVKDILKDMVKKIDVNMDLDLFDFEICISACRGYSALVIEHEEEKGSHSVGTVGKVLKKSLTAAESVSRSIKHFKISMSGSGKKLGEQDPTQSASSNVSIYDARTIMSILRGSTFSAELSRLRAQELRQAACRHLVTEMDEGLLLCAFLRWAELAAASAPKKTAMGLVLSDMSQTQTSATALSDLDLPKTSASARSNLSDLPTTGASAKSDFSEFSRVSSDGMKNSPSGRPIGLHCQGSRLSARYSPQGDLVPCCEWRVAETWRGQMRDKCALVFVPMARIFASWHRLAAHGRYERKNRVGRMSTVTQRVKRVVGGDAMFALKGRALFNALGLVERLYETRIASAERLLSFMVVFHRAVQPVSRMPMVQYDMDRSESRLRVASTPAPVPFVEELPPLTESHRTRAETTPVLPQALRHSPTVEDTSIGGVQLPTVLEAPMQADPEGKGEKEEDNMAAV